MKMNFWQWLGLIIFLIALGALIYRETGGSSTSNPPPPPIPSAPAPATTPAT